MRRMLSTLSFPGRFSDDDDDDDEGPEDTQQQAETDRASIDSEGDASLLVAPELGDALQNPGVPAAPPPSQEQDQQQQQRRLNPALLTVMTPVDLADGADALRCKIVRFPFPSTYPRRT